MRTKLQAGWETELQSWKEDVLKEVSLKIRAKTSAVRMEIPVRAMEAAAWLNIAIMLLNPYNDLTEWNLGIQLRMLASYVSEEKKADLDKLIISISKNRPPGKFWSCGGLKALVTPVLPAYILGVLKTATDKISNADMLEEI